MSDWCERQLHYSNLLDAAGATLLRMSFMIYRGRALTATMTATFHAKRVDTTKSRSAKHKRSTKINERCDHAPKYSGKKAMLIT